MVRGEENTSFFVITEVFNLVTLYVQFVLLCFLSLSL